MKLETLSIATFNLLNLNEPGLPLYTRPGWSEAALQRKVDWTAGQLALLDADVVGLQELWHDSALQRVLAQGDLAQRYDALVPADAKGKRIVCAALVRKGLLAGTPEWIADFPTGFRLQSGGDDPQTPGIRVTIKGFSRPVLRLAIRPRQDEAEVQVYVCHLKSKAPTQVGREAWFKADRDTYAPHAEALGAAISTVRRTAEAAALRWLLTERMKGNDAPVIVIGDINDGQSSNTGNILTGQPIYLVGDSLGGRDAALYTTQTLQEYRDTRDVYYTHVHQGLRESLDHILVSEQFYDHSRKRRWLFDGLVINNDHLNFEDHERHGTNDHGIVRAVFTHKPAKKV
ncbi:endonuclease/exonuclease/phosphatase family protein [Aquabacterium sp. J223]|uniref:endonuclease/exonuclease/phosphatase family protein n=1 Tax=Aquabacterium sp. J223 TaxID=2898431 RepID=UPI0021AD7038|nr:endonuclease/exonuclease/phosphatase family protein [Aquabacterium sp. J223]UUX97443.1 endonuclease/exonuclease/phosphatase family protein [Aquabacterium sp. J223]